MDFAGARRARRAAVSATKAGEDVSAPSSALIIFKDACRDPIKLPKSRAALSTMYLLVYCIDR
jgi:hypothetical protein